MKSWFSEGKGRGEFRGGEEVKSGGGKGKVENIQCYQSHSKSGEVRRIIHKITSADLSYSPMLLSV